MPDQTLEAVFYISQPFKFSAPRPVRYSEAKERSCKQAQDLFGCTARHLGSSCPKGEQPASPVSGKRGKKRKA